MFIIKKKNLFIFSLVILLCAISYLNYSINKFSLLETSQELEEYEENKLAKSNVLNENEQLVVTKEPTQEVVKKTEKNLAVIDSTESEVKDIISETSKTIENGILSKEKDNFFIESRLNINIEREKMLELLNEIINNDKTDDSSRKLANKEKMNIINTINKEKIVENLVRSKGFEDVVVFVTEHSVNVIVQTEELSSSDMAKILDIVTRETKTSMDNIKISNKF
ncbi:MAG: SpoIIIAH-like family protein [Anaeromicrobium sp.]|uniref:SpoIIIAH-like family protein n=1 Tax=Anaeromicrobium sp. TaxID=1929132 RepID=UPI0025EAFA63|nr:SpoIIIAH-like family protein [Anaeromicrobium sp.]MCT4596172.1 SpoIIIAH-like family protein [Anaeromicrobium sp.]